MTKLNATGTALVYSTYLGGSGNDEGHNIALDAMPDPNAYVSGITESADFPTTAGAIQTTFGGFQDGFVAKIMVPATAPADLSLTKTDAPDPVTVGQTLTYTLTVTNAGPGDASEVTVTDTLPSGVTFVSASASQGSCSGTSTVTCNLGNLATDASATVTIMVQPTAAGTLTNTASVEGNELDPDTGDNTDTESTTVSLAADLAVTKADSPDPVLAGANLTYTITATNNGPGAATGVMLTDTLPSGVTFVSSSASQGSCSGTSTVMCTLGSLANGASATVTIIVRPTAAGTLSNTASVQGNEGDPSTANNTDTETTTVNPAADLALAKSDSSDPVTTSQNLTYTLIATNNGPSSATGVTVTDTLPSGVSFVSSSTTQGSCSGTSTVTCPLGTLASGASATVTIVVKPSGAGTLTNSATVSGSQADPNTANNTDTETTTVTTPSQAIKLMVTVQGQGTVTSSPAGINCRPTCSATYSSGTQVTLTATAAAGYRFTGWSGACTGTTNPCTVTMTADRKVTATFKK